NLKYRFSERLGLATVNEAPVANDTPQTWEHIKRIGQILQETPGFDPMTVLPLIPKLLVKPETQQFGQQVASGLAQRAIARLIRELLLEEDPDAANASPKLALPPTR
ncbi:MAG TPA: hypothetical protein DD990_34985, partial [Cyanobacteria bacterium UBA11368]|nr:hypothetical protein [Cyanobacteria bacterium UBA11368]